MPITRAYASAAQPGNAFLAGKNKIINGDFAINQRGFTSQTTEGFIYDRFYFRISGDGTATSSAQTFTPGAAPVAGYEGANYVRIVTASQTTSAVRTILRQTIEGVRTFAGQTVTLSFWAKAGSGTPKIAGFFNQTFGSGGSSGVDIPAGSVTLSTSWARYSITYTLPSISGKTIGDNTNRVLVDLAVSAGSDLNTPYSSIGIQNNTFEIWGVQLEAGSVATAFQTATGTLAGELQAAQRYYEKSYEQSVSPTTTQASGYINSLIGSNTVTLGQRYNQVYFKVTKRTAPTVTVRPYTTPTNTGRVSNGQGVDLGAGSGTVLNAAESSFGVYNNSGASLTTTDQTIVFHYEASAEL